MHIETFTDEKKFTDESVGFVEKVCRGKTGVIRIALSGGSTPGPVYGALAKNTQLPFERIELYQVDERYVPSGHLSSNQKMIRESLIDPLRGRIKKFEVFETTLPIEAVVPDYAMKLEKFSQEGFDLMILGIGSDGHIASLFPGSSALYEKVALAVHTTTENFDIHDRFTLTYGPILKSKHLLVLLKGSQKKDILRKMQDPTIGEFLFPAKKLLLHPQVTVHFYFVTNP